MMPVSVRSRTGHTGRKQSLGLHLWPYPALSRTDCIQFKTSPSSPAQRTQA